MAQTKKNCPNCRRLIDIKATICPICQADCSSTSFPSKSVQKRAIPIKQVHIEDINELIQGEVKEKEFAQPDAVQSTAYTNKQDNSNSSTQWQNPKSNISSGSSNSDEPEFDEEIKEDTEPEEITASDMSDIKTNEGTIRWSDEPEKQEPDYSKAYDKNGVYQPNFDGYYNDTLPKIANEVDRLLAGKEKAILKVIVSLVGIVAIIVYLVITTYH